MTITIIVSLITALAAVLAPCLTEIFRNHNNLRLKKLELFYQKKQESYLDLADAYGKYRVYPNSGKPLMDLFSSIYKAMIFSDKFGNKSLENFLEHIGKEGDEKVL